MKYIGYTGVVELAEGSDVLFGHVIGLRDVIAFQRESVAEVTQAFHDSVDDDSIRRELGLPVSVHRTIAEPRSDGHDWASGSTPRRPGSDPFKPHVDARRENGSLFIRTPTRNIIGCGVARRNRAISKLNQPPRVCFLGDFRQLHELSRPDC
jgi:hypothetical protein